MKRVQLPNGMDVPAVGLGTWGLGERSNRRSGEIEAVRTAIDLGYRLIDTAEMYGEGNAEEIVGAALAAACREPGIARDAFFVVSKVYPHHASRDGVVAACERTLRRLGIDWLDAYLLHWRGGHPLAETIAGFEALQSRGLVRAWGVSNFDFADMQDLWRAGGQHCAVNQVYYSLSKRGVEFDLVPWQRRACVATMAYSPIDQGALASHEGLDVLAADLAITPAQLALAWLVQQSGTIAIPKAVQPQHLQQNLAAARIKLAASVLVALDRMFPPPTRKVPLAIL